jgi:hypothetical protein
MGEEGKEEVFGLFVRIVLSIASPPTFIALAVWLIPIHEFGICKIS